MHRYVHQSRDTWRKNIYNSFLQTVWRPVLKTTDLQRKTWCGLRFETKQKRTCEAVHETCCYNTNVLEQTQKTVAVICSLFIIGRHTTIPLLRFNMHHPKSTQLQCEVEDKNISAQFGMRPHASFWQIENLSPSTPVLFDKEGLKLPQSLLKSSLKGRRQRVEAPLEASFEDFEALLQYTHTDTKQTHNTLGYWQHKLSSKASQVKGPPWGFWSWLPRR